jgi:glycosyltransferase involved in cell wall biosynthesis
MTILYMTCFLDVSGVTKINFDILVEISCKFDICVCETVSDEKLSSKLDIHYKEQFGEILQLWRLPATEQYPFFVRYLKDNAIDLVYTTHSLWVYEHAAKLKRDLSWLKIVDSLHVLEPYCFRGGYPDISANRFVHPYIDASILISRNLENYLISNYKVDQSKFFVIHNGIDTSLFRSTSDDSGKDRSKQLPDVSGVTVGFIGRFTYQKRPLLFVDIVHELAEKNPDINFYMVGNGPLFDKVSTRIERLGFKDRIHLLSAQSDIASLLSETDVLVLPSSYEGAPLTILEALAVGTKVVVSDVGAVREYVGERCRLIPLGNAGMRERQHYVSAIEKSLAEGKRSGLLKPEHDIKVVAASYRSVFEKVLN